jgi:hypothetical protein
VSVLLSRLTAIARRELDERTLDPGDAQDLLDLVQAAVEVVVLTYDPAKSTAQNDEFQRRARRFNKALAKFGVGPEGE